MRFTQVGLVLMLVFTLAFGAYGVYVTTIPDDLHPCSIIEDSLIEGDQCYLSHSIVSTVVLEWKNGMFMVYVPQARHPSLASAPVVDGEVILEWESGRIKISYDPETGRRYLSN